ncbi:MAG: LysM peptidoglycan-binding domain-containing protein [Opitutaceae bacterium]|nr:LysM peptidoglycan-binding domain-containing protein [Opitutaceae bacterium]
MSTSFFRLCVPACVLLIGSWALAQTAAESPEIASLRTKAEKGNSIAQYNLGLAYSTGRDVAQDLPEAYVWLTLAAENGTTGRVLQNLQEQMTPAQLADAQNRLNARRQALGLATTATTVTTAAGTTDVDAAQLVADKKQLSQELALAWQEADRLKAGLDEARTARDNALADLRSSTTELATLRAAAARFAANQSGAETAAIQSLRQELQDVRATAATMAQREQELEDIAAQRGRETGEAKAQLAAAMERIATLNQTVASLEKRPAAAATDPAATARIAELTDQLNALGRRLGQSESAHENALGQLEQVSRELETARTRISRLETDNSRLDQALAAAPKPGAHEEAEARLLQANSKRIEAEDRARKLSAELERAQAALTAAAAPTTPDPALTAQIEELQSALARRESDRADATTRIAGLTAQLHTLRSELTESETARSAAADRAAAVTRELDDSRNRLARLESENKQLLAAATTTTATDRVAELEETLASARADHAAAQAQLAALKAAPPAATAPDQSAELAALENKLSITLRSYTLLQDENDRLKASSDQLAAQMAALEHQLAGAHRDINDLSGRLETTTAAAAESESVTEQLRQVRDELNASRDENTRLRTRLAALSPSPTATLSAPTRPGSAQAATIVAPPPTAAPTRTAPTPAPAPAVTGPRSHVVVAGDTLSGLARDYYGSSVRWAEIYEANREQLPNERALRIGMTLVIP